MPVEIKTEDKSELIFSFDDDFKVFRFDDDSTHIMPEMSRVDLIATSAAETWLLADVTWLIEVKDPDTGKIPIQHHRARHVAELKKIHDEAYFKNVLAPKLRDTLVYLALSNQAPAKQIKFIVFIGLSALDRTMLLTATDMLEQHCYLRGNKKPWPSNFAVIVTNMAAWNEDFKPHSVRRGP